MAICPIIVHFSTKRARSMHDVAWRGMWICVCSKDAQKQLARTSLRWLTTVLMEYKSTIFNSFEEGSKLFFPSLFNACLSLLPFYVKFEQLNVNKWPK